jgi:predicted AAA+ superfamily ATPase
MVKHNNAAAPNYTAVARDVSMPARSLQFYYEIPEETYIGMRLPVFSCSTRKQLTHRPKFYLFNTGDINAVQQRLTVPLFGSLRGTLFEHFIILMRIQG